MNERMCAIEEIRLRIMGGRFPSLFKPWEILKVLTALIGEGKLSIPMHAADCVGIVGLPEEVGRMRTTFVRFNKMKDKVLSLLRGGLVSYTRIVQEGLCAGNHVQHCNVCREEVTVWKADVDYLSPVLPDGHPVFVLGSAVTYTLCGREMCSDQNNMNPFRAGRDELGEVYR